MKIATLEESADFATLDTEKLFSKLNLMSCLGRVVRTMMLLLLVRLLLLVLVLVVMWLTPPTLLTHLLRSLLHLPCVQLLMSSTTASPTMRSPCWRESSARCTDSARRGGDLLGAALSAATPLTSSPTTPRGRSSSPPPTSMTTPSETTIARATIGRSTASEIRRRSFRR
jgi:hypothetical protein